jgi:glutaredoxin
MKRVVSASIVLFAAWSAHAQYKVVGPDGRVTYTDRPPPAEQGQAVQMRAGSGGSTQPALPLALKEPATKFPVILYTAPECGPCDEGRALLRQRGIPYTERAAANNADREAWVKIVGSADAPALAIGGQWLRGYSPSQWNSYLDTAGYPRESKLPPGYVQPAPLPLVERVAVPRAEPPPPAPPPAPEAPAPGSIRF